MLLLFFFNHLKSLACCSYLANLISPICKLRVKDKQFERQKKKKQTTKTPVGHEHQLTLRGTGRWGGGGEIVSRPVWQVEHGRVAVAVPAACFRERAALTEQRRASGTMAALRCRPCAAAFLACSDTLGPQRCQKCEGLMSAPGRGTRRRTMRLYSPWVNTLLNACVLFVFLLPVFFFLFPFALASRSGCLIHAALQSTRSVTLKGRFKNKCDAGTGLKFPRMPHQDFTGGEKKNDFCSFVLASLAEARAVVFLKIHPSITVRSWMGEFKAESSVEM